MNDLDQLVSDSKLVVGYLSRMGLLGASPLPGIVADVEDAIAKGQPVDKSVIVSLTVELSNAMARIYPVTLIDLGTKWRPFGVTRQSPVLQFVFAAISVFIILLTGYYTQIYIRSNDAMSGLMSVQQKNPLDKSIRIFMLYKKVPAVVTLTPSDQIRADDFQFEPFLQSYEELHNLNDELGTYTREASALNVYAYQIPGVTPVTNILGAVSKSLFHASDHHVDVPQAPAVATIGTQLESYSGKAATSLTPVANTQGSGHSSPQASALASAENLSEEDERAYFLNDLGVTYIATMTSKNVGLDNNTINGMISMLQGIVEIYGTLILPVLYGLLGTIVFEMRKMLNPLRPNTATIRIVVRTFMGGLTGLIIAFLFKPLHADYGQGQFAGASVFLVAFLMGFSIDVFFTMLDGLVSALTRSITPKTT